MNNALKIHSSNNFHILTHKTEQRAEILAKMNTKKIGYANLSKINDDWRVNQFYIDTKFNQLNSLQTKLLNKINELQKDASTTNALASILTYMEKD